MMRVIVALCLVSGVRARAAHHIDLKDQQVVSVTPANTEEARWFEELQSTRGGVVAEGSLDFWTDVKHVGRPVDVRVNAAQKAEITAAFGEERVTVKVEDVSQLVGSFNWANPKPAGKRWAPNEYHDEYHSFEEIVQFLGQLEEDYSDLVSVSQFGSSHEGRAMLVACISTDGCSGAKPAFVVNGGIHAREWISHATGKS